MLSSNLTSGCPSVNPESPAPPAPSHTPHRLGQRRRHPSLGDDHVARHSRRIEIQGRHLAAGRIPQSCSDTGRISPEAIVHAAWLIQVEREAAAAAAGLNRLDGLTRSPAKVYEQQDREVRR